MSSPRTAFDAYVAIDWSANGTPKTGEDSIWIAWSKRADGNVVTAEPVNPRTRNAATDFTIDRLALLVADGARVLGGFDVAYGAPRGLARALALDERRKPWLAFWDELAGLIHDGPDNANNRFRVASCLNERLGGPGPYCGGTGSGLA